MPALLWTEMRVLLARLSASSVEPSRHGEEQADQQHGEHDRAAGQRGAQLVAPEVGEDQAAGTSSVPAAPRPLPPAASQIASCGALAPPRPRAASPCRGGRRVDEAQGARVVRDHDDRLAELVLELAQQAEDVLGVARVEVAGGLVGDDEIGIGDDGARDGDALLLAARERARRVVAVRSSSPTTRSAVSARRVRSSLSRWVSSSGSATLSRADEHRNQVEELEDQADVPRAPARPARLR